MSELERVFKGVLTETLQWELERVESTIEDLQERRNVLIKVIGERSCQAATDSN